MNPELDVIIEEILRTSNNKGTPPQAKLILSNKNGESIYVADGEYLHIFPDYREYAIKWNIGQSVQIVCAEPRLGIWIATNTETNEKVICLHMLKNGHRKLGF